MTNIALHKNYFKAAIITGCFFMYSCENNMQEVTNLGKKRTGKEVAENVESYMSQDAHVKAKLTAPVMIRTETDTPVVEFPKTLRVEFYNDSAKPESHLFAKYGRYLEKQGKVFLQDSVFVFNIKGDTLLTDELWWDRNKELFYNSKPVTIRQAHNQSLNGDSIIADQNFTWYTLYNGSGIRNVPDSTLPSN